MRALVAFGTTYGSTAKVAEEIAKVLRCEGTETTVWDLRAKLKEDINGFDLVVVGSGIIAGSWTPEALRFLETRGSALAGRSVALFACCGDVVLKRSPIEDCRKRYLVEVASRTGISDPLALGLFGGVLDFERYGFLVKAVLNGTRKNIEAQGIDLSRPYDFRNWEEIDDWARSLLTGGPGKGENGGERERLASDPDGGA